MCDVLVYVLKAWTQKQDSWQPTVYMPSFEPSISPRTHHKLELLKSLFGHMVQVKLFARKDFLILEVKILRTIVNGPWYVRNEDIRRDLGMPTVKEDINRYSEKYKLRIATHINRLAAETYKITNMDRRLKRKHPTDLIKDIT